MRLYKLTTEKYAIENCKKHRLKVSIIQDLNDPYELLSLRLPDKYFRKKFYESRENFSKIYGIVSFSKSWSNPVLWSHYGDKHAGICLGFDVSDRLLSNVQYFNTQKCIKNYLEKDLDIDNTDIFYELLSYKFKDWSYEREARIIVKLKECDKENGLYFFPFSDDIILKEIIIGPRCKKTPKDILGKDFSLLNDVEIIKARLAFNSYSVVPNRHYKSLILQKIIG